MAAGLGPILRGNISSADLSAAPADLTSAPGAGNKVHLLALVVSAAAAMRVDLTEETSGTVVLSIHLAANTTVVVPLAVPLKLDTAAKKLQAQSSAAGAVRIMALYRAAP